MKILAVFLIMMELGFSSISFGQSPFESQNVTDLTARRLSAMYKNFAGTYIENQEKTEDDPFSGGETLFSVFVENGALKVYWVSPFSTVPNELIPLSLEPFHRDYEVYSPHDIGSNAVGSIEIHRVANGIERIEARTGKFKRDVRIARVVLDHGVLSVVNRRQFYKRLAFFGPWVAVGPASGREYRAVKIAERPIPVAELKRTADLNPDAYSASTGEGIYSDNEINEAKPQEMGQVIPFKPRSSNKCAELYGP